MDFNVSGIIDEFVNETLPPEVFNGVGKKALGGYVPPPDKCLKFDFFNYVILLGFLTIFGLIGNTLSQTIFWKKVRTNSTSFLLFTLALYDDVILVGHFFGKGVPIICAFLKTGTRYLHFADPYFQAYGWIGVHLAQMCSTWTIVLVSFCRYIAVCKPHDTAKYTSINKIRIAVPVMMVINVAIYAPRVKLFYVIDTGERYLRIKDTVYGDSMLFTVFNTHIYYITMFLIPFILLIIKTHYQFRALKMTKEVKRNLTRRKSDERDVNITLIVVVLTFMICNIWEPIRRLSEMIPGVYTDCTKLKYHAYSLKAFFTAFNSAINIVIYSTFRKQFRRDLLRKFHRGNTVFPETTVTYVEPLASQNYRNSMFENSSRLNIPKKY